MSAPAAGSIAIRPLAEADLPFAMRLSDAAGWNQTEPDWRLFLDARPAGCFLALRGGSPAGTVATIEHGDVGWVSLLLVDEMHRRHGIGTALLERGLESLAGAKVVALDATPQGKLVYDRFGFVDEERLARWTAPRGGRSPAAGGGSRGPPVRLLRRSELGRAARLDERSFGAPRDRVVAHLFDRAPSLAFLAEEGSDPGGPGGLVLGRDGVRFTHIGPLHAPDRALAEALVLRALAAAGPGACGIDAFERGPEWSAFLERAGFVKRREFIRMRRGAAPLPGDHRLAWAAAGPELG